MAIREDANTQSHPHAWQQQRTVYERRLFTYWRQPPVREDELTPSRRRLIEEIRAQTAAANVNNLTRTDAYLRIYLAHPELHWALLAHLVSRNGGWNMTDLRGDAVRPVLSAASQERYFAFLERCNFLIFYDAYPQLLLYAYSKRNHEPVFDLLPCLGVSSFMRAAWETYWEDHCTGPLVIAQIINEQSFIEQRVVQNEVYAPIFQEPSFSAQSLFHLVSVFFPAQSVSGRIVGLYGNRVRDFTSLTERIAVGKSLYALLFPKVSAKHRAKRIRSASAKSRVRGPVSALLRFARTVSHSGSRTDYMPSLFSREKHSDRLYSPALREAWPDSVQAPVEPGDWCHNMEPIQWLNPPEPPPNASLMPRYRERIRLLKKGANAIGPTVRGR